MSMAATPSSATISTISSPALRTYARFLLSQSRDAKQGGLFDGFAGLAVRKVIRPTRFYYMLLQRLKDHRTMGDGVTWSAQADFLARLADWERFPIHSGRCSAPNARRCSG